MKTLENQKELGKPWKTIVNNWENLGQTKEKQEKNYETL